MFYRVKNFIKQNVLFLFGTKKTARRRYLLFFLFNRSEYPVMEWLDILVRVY